MKKAVWFIGLILIGYPMDRGLSMERFEIVTTTQMKQMLEARAEGKQDFVLVNTLDEIIFMHSAIPGSVNIPWSRAGALTHRLGEDKDTLLVFY